jgi:membrane-bound serine protease (ClpP class)
MINKHLKLLRLGLLFAFTAVVMGAPAAMARPAWAQSESREAVVLNVVGPLTPAFTVYIQRGISQAERDGAAVVIIQLNTPGGAIDLMTDIVTEIRGSTVPVVVFVSPRGAMAASAGTVITLAGHVAAMAPETIIGAASPVGSQGEDLSTTEAAKTKEALKATVRTLTLHRGPKAVALANSAIDTATAATADEAYAAGLVDFLAPDVPSLLSQLNGFQVDMNGQTVQLETSQLTVTEVPINLLETLLNILTNPNVVFLLLALGAQAILIEVANPGGWIPGFIGAVSLALALYGMGVLSVNWFGLIFVVVAFVLFILDIKAPTHGALTAAGAASLIAGALVLFNSPGTPGFLQVNVILVVVTSLALAAGFAVILAFAVRAQRRPLALGVQTLIGQVGEVRSAESVQVGSELWSAVTGDSPLEPGEKVEVVGVRGLKVVVKKRL